MQSISINTEYIKLDQMLKYCGIVDRGCDAKEIIKQGNIMVNGETELRRGRKLRKGDVVSVENVKCIIE